ncbi:MAG: type IV secretion system protein [Wolbachia sp.]|nr:type IV secretion system protein [Wolbachia sp.]
MTSLDENSTAISTKQNWVNSGIEIEDSVRITDIDVVPSNFSFCANQHRDFVATNKGFTATTEIDFAALGLNDSDQVSVINEQINYLEGLQEKSRIALANKDLVSYMESELSLRDTSSGRVGYCFNKKGFDHRIETAESLSKHFGKNMTWKDVPSGIAPDKIDEHIQVCKDNRDYFERSLKSFSLPFALKAGDSISFSVVEKKVCKKNEDGKERFVNIDNKCSEGEKEHFNFAKVLNQKECQGDVCPNKYILGNAKWLNGKEHWNYGPQPYNMKDSDEASIVRSIKEGKGIDCNKLIADRANKIDMYIFNSLCGSMCDNSNQDCVQVESFIKSNELLANLKSALADVNDATEDEKNKIIGGVIQQFMEGEVIQGFTGQKKEVKTYIPSLKITMANENFEHVQGGIRTNYEYKIENDHKNGEKLNFILGNTTGNGGYNIRVTKHHNYDDLLKKSLYMHVSDKNFDDDVPEHKAGEDSGDIPIEIERIYDINYMNSLRKSLKGKKGTIYYGIRDHGCNYENEGNFSINITTKSQPKKSFSVLYNFFEREVKTAFFGSSYRDPKAVHSDSTSPVQSLYRSFISSNRTGNFRSTIVALLVLYIVLYTLYYFFGLSYISIYEFLIICVKIGVITQLLRDDSWDFFYNKAFSLLINTPTQLIKGIANFRGTDPDNPFQFLDLPLNRFLSTQSWFLVISLIFSGPLGIVAFCLVFWGLITVMLAIFNALFSFITSIAIIALLLSLAPIFIICILFTYTRQMFRNWVNYLARFAISPVILLVSLSLVSQVMDYIVYSMFDFEVCSTCIIRINLILFEPCIFYGYATKYTPNITAMMAFVILGHAMKALIEASSNLSDSLFSVYVSDEPGKNYQQTMLGLVGLDQDSSQMRTGGISSSGGEDKKPQIPIQRPQIPTGD